MSRLRFLFLLSLGLAVPVTGFSQGRTIRDAETDRVVSTRPKIQLAILLDTSGSMEGLINQARTQLWKIVNDLSRTKCRGVTPEFQVALYEYGKNSLSASEGYLRQIVPLSDNLDLISEKLFELKTNGGSEYCGWVIQDAVLNLEWSRSNDDLKMIFIAGNEPFTQGPVDYRISCKAAVEKGIAVSTIHCGDESEGRRGQWADGAAIANGSFMNINHDIVEVDPPTPYDKKLLELSGKLNTTYLSYGNAEARQEFAERQRAQDANAAEATPAAGASRALSKSSSFYKNSQVDLIDAKKEGKVKLEEIPKDQLPEPLRKLSVDELNTVVDKKAQERAAIQKEIKDLSAQRDKFLADERSKQADGDVENLDDAVLKAVRKQAEVKQFTYEKE